MVMKNLRRRHVQIFRENFTKIEKVICKIENRIMQEKRALARITCLFYSEHVIKDVKYRIYKAVLETILLCGVEAFRLAEGVEGNVCPTEIIALKMSARIPKLQIVHDQRKN